MGDLWRAFQELLPIGVGLAIALTFAIGCWWRLENSGRHQQARRLSWVVCAMWAVGAGLVTLRPRPPTITASGATVTRTVDLIPGSDLWDVLFRSVSGRVLLEQIAGNIVLFAPLGVGLGMLTASLRPKPQFGLVAGALAGLLFETLQWVLGAGRVSSTDDVILACLGTAVGFITTAHVLRLIKARKSTRARGQAQPQLER